MFAPPSLPRTFEAALRDLRAPKASIRAEAVHDLGRHADASRPRVLAALEEALGDEDAKVRAAAATALADIEGHEAVDALIAAVDDDDVTAAQMAIATLGELGEARAAARVERALSDRRPELRFQAVIAFPRLSPRPEAATEALVKASYDDDELVCHIALRMAEELAATREEEIDPRILSRSRTLLSHGTPLVRVAAAILLAPSDDRAAKEALVAVAKRDLKTKEGEDEARAIELCGELGLEEARAGLERRAFGGGLLGRDRFAWHARVALARMGHARACREIVSELRSWNRDRRTLAVAAAGRARLFDARTLIAGMAGDPSRADPDTVDDALALLAQPNEEATETRAEAR